MAAKSRLKNKSLFTFSILLLAISAFVFEQSPANEALRAIIGFSVLNASNNPLLVGLAVGVITLCIEFISSGLIALGLNTSPRFQKFANKRNYKINTSSSFIGFSDLALLLGIGSGMVVIKKHISGANLSLKQDIILAFRASVAVAIFSAFVGFLAGGGIEIARNFGLATASQSIVDLATNWLFWIIFIIVTQSISMITNKIKNTQNN